ncbi:MAG: hypothetical protein ACRDD1_13060, partial [Planctomycetia bacterium]
TLFAVDLRDYGFSQEVYADLSAKDPYLRRYYTPHLKAGGIVRADWWIVQTSLDPEYSRWLRLPPQLADLKKEVAVDEDAVKRLSLNNGGAVLESIVALHNRRLERFPTLTGYWWQTYDTASGVGRQNVLEALADDLNHDAGEFIWSLPNGLQGYYLANAAGAQAAEVPPNLAVDGATSAQDKRVRNAASCVTCHPTGLNAFDDVVAKLVRSGTLDLVGKDKRVADALADFYLTDAGLQIADDEKRYAAAVKRCNDLTPDDNAAAFERLFVTHAERRIDLETACREVGVDAERFKAAARKSTSGTVLALVAGERVARDAFEGVFGDVLDLLYEE